MKKIERVSPGDARHIGVADAIKQQRGTRIDYDAISEQYNSGPINSYILIKVPRSASLGNLTKVLHGRGLVRYIDFDIMRQKVTSKGHDIPTNNRPVIITKLTDSTMN